METARVDVVYRPLRIGFALISEDRVSFRKVVRLCSAFWGGRYNPILAVDRPEAADLVEVFRPDFLVPIGDDPAIAAFVASYTYLRNPLFSTDLFFPASHGREGQAKLLDIQNLINHRRETADWRRLQDAGVRIPCWDRDDPLADAFLAQFGGFPDPAEIGIEYGQIVSQVTGAVEIPIAPDGTVPSEIFDHPGISHINRFGLEPHYTSNSNWIYPGLYAGDASNGVDLINFWNLRACGIPLLFMDEAHRQRTAEFQSLYIERLRAELSSRHTFQRQPAIWSRDEVSEQAREAVGEGGFFLCTVGEASWNGLNIRPQRMYFGEESSLGVLGGSPARPRIRFALKEKPFSSDVWYHQQHLVASISLLGEQSDGTDYTFQPPCISELNEFAARAMHYEYDGLRLEPKGVGLVIGTTVNDIGLTALSLPALIEQIFGLGGFSAKLSGGGLIARQLISRMGGVDGTRVFKIPGVRKLLKTHGPNASFTRRGALQIIGSSDRTTGSRFTDYRGLFIEPRHHLTDLTPAMVFSHLVAKGLFRIGADLECPACSLSSWTALDELRQKSVCPLCGNAFDATRQLVEGDYAYRRSGVLGLERNTQGAVPVVLLLQQLSVNFMGIRSDNIFGVSYDLAPKEAGGGLPTCETDFCVLVPTHSGRTSVIIGECKDAGGTIDQNDIDHLRHIADSLPQKRFDVFILLAKLAPFNADEIALAKTLNSSSWMRRVIMLTARELEPYHIFERANAEMGLNLQTGTPKELAESTYRIYFESAAEAHSDAIDNPHVGDTPSTDQN